MYMFIVVLFDFSQHITAPDTSCLRLALIDATVSTALTTNVKLLENLTCTQVHKCAYISCTNKSYHFSCSLRELLSLQNYLQLPSTPENVYPDSFVPVALSICLQEDNPLARALGINKIDEKCMRDIRG